MVRAPFTAVQPRHVPVAEMPSINAFTDPLPAITVKYNRSETILTRVVSHQLAWTQRLVGLVQSGKSKHMSVFLLFFILFALSPDQLDESSLNSLFDEYPVGWQKAISSEHRNEYPPLPNPSKTDDGVLLLDYSVLKCLAVRCEYSKCLPLL